MSNTSGKEQAKSWQPPAVQTATKGFSARPLPEMAISPTIGKQASHDHSSAENLPGGIIDNINRTLASARPPASYPESGEMGVQAKLTLGTVGDVYEQEADRVARQVVKEIHSSPFRARNTMSPSENIANGGQGGRVQRQITVRSSRDAGGDISSEWESELIRARGGGQPLSPFVKEPMEQAFGADFSGVRVHTDSQADQLNQSIQAKAFTTGQDVFFRQGAYEPGSRGGQELLAHELTHVMQQSGVGLTGTVWRMKEGDAVGGEGPSPETTLPGSSIRVEVWERRDLHTIEKRLSDLRLRRDKEGVDEGILDMANKILEQLQKLLLEQSEERSLSDGVAAPVLKMHEIEMLKKTALEGVSVLEGRTRGKWPVSRQGGGDVDRPAVPERVWGDWGKSLRNLCLELIVHCKNMLERVT